MSSDEWVFIMLGVALTLWAIKRLIWWLADF